MLGERNGGISLWLALLGFEVLCTDYRLPEERVRRLHRRWRVEDRVAYATADVFKLNYPDDCFEVVVCKSVLGGLALDYKDNSTRTLENQKLATGEIKRVLRPGGIFLGAENLTGTRLHRAARGIRHKGNPGWRYLRLSEIQWLFDGYAECVQKPYGFVGTGWPGPGFLNVLLAGLDGLLSRMLPADWLYISFIRARK